MNDQIFSRNQKAGHEPKAMASLDALVLGAGAVSQNMLLTLALEGPRRIRIVDADDWSDDNATRSPLYGSPELRRRCENLKAATVAHELRRITSWNPDLVIEYQTCWVQQLGDAPFREASVVISCVDQPRARAYLAAMCHLHDKPMVEGGVGASSGSFAVYAEVEGPCWQCGAPVPQGVRVGSGCKANAREMARQGFQAMTQPVASIVGSYMAEAAIQLAHGNRALSGRRAFIDDVRNPSTTTLDESRGSACPCPHEALPPVDLLGGVDEDSTVGDLLKELGATVEEPTLLLRTPFVAQEFCAGPLDDRERDCGVIVDVNAPEWTLRRHPRCKRCGGEFARSEDDRASTYHEVSHRDRKLHSFALKRLGYASRDTLTIKDKFDRVYFVQLSGDAPGFVLVDAAD